MSDGTEHADRARSDALAGVANGRAAVYTETGGPDVLQVMQRPIREPGPGEVRVRMHRAGVNPTDWYAREGEGPGHLLDPAQVPGQDGAGVVDAVGSGVEAALLGLRVWAWEAAYRRPDGTAQESAIVPARQVVTLPDLASFDLGASLGIPFITAHRCLTVTEHGPLRLGPGTLDGRVVLVAGGAGAVGNAAIQLARWSDATVIATVSSPRKAQLAAAAGADHVINYRQQDVVSEIRKISPRGADTIVEVAPASNASIDAAVVTRFGSVAIYNDGGGDDLTLPVGPLLAPNARWQFVLVYTAPAEAKGIAVDDIAAAIIDGAIRVGEDAGLPLHHFPLDRAADAHAAVQQGAVGKVLIDLVDE
jgi:NADPH2:quinone reductase